MKSTYLRIIMSGGVGAILGLAAASAPAQTLPVTSGLQLWLKADAGVTTNGTGAVTRWADQSGLGNDALQTDPTKAPTVQLKALNGKPTLHYDGSTRYLDVADSASISGLTEDVTILVLVEFDDLNAYRCSVGKTLGNGPAPFDCWNNASASSGRNNMWLGNGTPSSYQDFVSLAPPAVSNYNVMGFSWGNGVVDQYLNDVGNGHFTYTTTPADGGKPLRVGSRDDLATQLKGGLAEVLIYQPELSDDQRNAVIGYLRTKWALAFNLPPTVGIQTPTNGTTVAALGTVQVTVNASDPDGTVARVDLLNNGALVASWPRSPYLLTLGLLSPGTANLVAVATDNGGKVTTSAPVAITVTGTASTSLVTNGLKLWLRADAGVTTNSDGSVAAWSDQSGSGNDAAQAISGSAPLWAGNLINGKPALRFPIDASTPNRFMAVPDTGTTFTAGDLTTFVVARFTDFASYRALWAKTSSGLAAPIDWWFAPNTGVPTVYRGDGTAYGGPVTGLKPAPVGYFDTVGLAVSGSNITHYLGFGSNGRGVIAATPADAGGLLRIGTRDDAVTQLNGDIAEMVIYDHALSDADSSNVLSYLNGKYGLAQAANSNLPPTVSVSEPTNGASFVAPASIPFTATASDPYAPVARVDLMANGSLLASLTNSPYHIKADLLTPGQFTLTAVAADYLGVLVTSAPVVVTVTGTGTTTPATTDLRLWLRADKGVTTNPDGTVATWADQTTNGNNAGAGTTSPTVAANALNGKPAIHFDGSGTYLEVPTAPSIELAGDVASYAVVRYDDFAAYQALWAKTAGSAGNLPASIDYYLPPGAGIPRLYRGNGAGNSNGYADANRPVAAGAYIILGFEMAGTTATHYFNGTPAGGGQITAALADGGTPLKIGTRGDLFTKLKGDLAELLVFGHALSVADRTQVLSYLGAKYGMPQARFGNSPPTVTLSSPTNGATLSEPGVINVTAQANGPDSPISRVDFLVDGAVVSSVSAPPYTLALQALTPGTVTLQAQVVDVWGLVGQSAPVTLTLTGPSPAAPPTSGLALWLKADAGVSTNSDGTVATWADQSGLTNNAVQNPAASGPVLMADATLGKPVLEFDGTMARYLDVASVPSTVIVADISSFCAFKLPDLVGTRAVWTKTSSGQAYPWNYHMAGATPEVLRGNSNGQWPIAASAPLLAGQFAVAGFTIQAATTTHYLNGQPNGSGAMGFGAADMGTVLRIGARDDALEPFSGELGEILIYSRALTGSDLQLANTYLAGKYGIAVVQVATQPSGPSLSITRVGSSTVQVSWPAGLSGFVLEERAGLTGGAWSPVATNPPNNQITLSATNATLFYRLRSQ